MMLVDSFFLMRRLDCNCNAAFATISVSKCEDVVYFWVPSDDVAG
jgi:hypothetical protein